MYPYSAWMVPRGDGPVVLHLLPFQLKLYLFSFKVELKCITEGGIFEQLGNMLQPKEVVFIGLLNNTICIHNK